MKIFTTIMMAGVLALSLSWKTPPASAQGANPSIGKGVPWLSQEIERMKGEGWDRAERWGALGRAADESQVRQVSAQFAGSAATGQEGRMSRRTGRQSLAANTGFGVVPLAQSATTSLAYTSVDMTAIPSGRFAYGSSKQVSPTPAGVRYAAGGTALPAVSTSSVDFNNVDLPFIKSMGGNGDIEGTGYSPSQQDGFQGGGTGVGGNPAPPYPAPGPGYQPIYQHGEFVGYMSPGLIQQMQTDPAGAWTAFANSSDYTGDEGLRLSLLYETGAITPEQQAELDSLALFGI